MFRTHIRNTLNTLAVAMVGALALLCSCESDPTCMPERLPQFDWQDINERIIQVVDVGDFENLTDEQLSAKYTTNKIEAVVRHPSTNGNRYLLLVQRAGRHQAIVIPGTNVNNIEDLLANFDSAPVLDPELGVEFHRGFLEMAEEVRADVEPLLNTRYATHLTGYSLGGAMAAILALQLNLHGYDVQSVVTFGQPKVTFADGADLFADRPLLRFIAARDGIPMFFADQPYMHFGDEIILLDGPNLVYLKPSDPNYVLSTLPPPEAPAAAFNANDHGSYMARIASMQDGGITSVSYCSREQFIESE